MYGHVITKFSGMGRFTYPGCSACARFAHARAPLKIDRLGIIYISIIARFFCEKVIILLLNYGGGRKPGFIKCQSGAIIKD